MTAEQTKGRGADPAFRPVGSQVSFPELEERVLGFWRESDVFRRSQSEGGGQVDEEKPLFMFYEGPPTANGPPGIHHVFARVFKDVIPRYKTMRGYRIIRKGGWDTHGLPVELEVEKELGLSSKQEIEAYGIDRFNARCRESVMRHVKAWEDLTERIGYWVDMDDAYATFDNSYIETGWWLLKQLWDKGLVYEGMKGTPHCPRCVTSLSSHEVALGYQEDTPDPSVFVRFSFDAARTRGTRGETAGAQGRTPPRRRADAPRPRQAGLLPGVDDDPLDAARQHRSRCRSGVRVRPSEPRRAGRPAGARLAPYREGPGGRVYRSRPRCAARSWRACGTSRCTTPSAPDCPGHPSGGSRRAWPPPSPSSRPPGARRRGVRARGRSTLRTSSRWTTGRGSCTSRLRSGRRTTCWARRSGCCSCRTWTSRAASSATTRGRASS